MSRRNKRPAPILRRRIGRLRGDDKFLRMVQSCKQNGTGVDIKMDCGHEIYLTRDSGTHIWVDEVPGWIDCPMCESGTNSGKIKL
jgi:hypothetical protein